VARLLGSFALVVCAVGVLSASASAITNGELDGTLHPYAGALVIDGRPACSAVLVSPTVVVTAGHCVAGAPTVAVGFDGTLDLSSSALVTGTPHVDSTPGSDLAVVVLDRAATVVPARLPAARSLEGVRSVVAVGYGYHDVKPEFAFDGLRRYASLEVKSLDGSTVELKERRDGSVCFGDSGGPQLDGDTVVAITLAGSKHCKGASTGYRLDSPAARGFLSAYVALP
jgi:hypothetical protein